MRVVLGLTTFFLTTSATEASLCQKQIRRGVLVSWPGSRQHAERVLGTRPRLGQQRVKSDKADRAVSTSGQGHADRSFQCGVLEAHRCKPDPENEPPHLPQQPVPRHSPRPWLSEETQNMRRLASSHVLPLQPLGMGQRISILIPTIYPECLLCTRKGAQGCNHEPANKRAFS